MRKPQKLFQIFDRVGPAGRSFRKGLSSSSFSHDSAVLLDALLHCYRSVQYSFVTGRDCVFAEPATGLVCPSPRLAARETVRLVCSTAPLNV
jgi:hypothetical protein